jgi:hypothetical protein
MNAEDESVFWIDYHCFCVSAIAFFVEGPRMASIYHHQHLRSFICSFSITSLETKTSDLAIVPPNIAS